MAHRCPDHDVGHLRRAVGRDAASLPRRDGHRHRARRHDDLVLLGCHRRDPAHAAAGLPQEGSGDRLAGETTTPRRGPVYLWLGAPGFLWPPTPMTSYNWRIAS